MSATAFRWQLSPLRNETAKTKIQFISILKTPQSILLPSSCYKLRIFMSILEYNI